MKSIDHSQITALPDKGDSRARSLKQLKSDKNRMKVKAMLQEERLKARQATKQNQSNFKRNVTDKMGSNPEPLEQRPNPLEY